MHLYNEHVNLEDLLAEDQETIRKRVQAKEMVTALSKSLEFLNDVRDFYFENESF